MSRADPALSVRVPPDVAAQLETFVAEEPDWSKTEIVAVGVHTLLAASHDQRMAFLTAYRSRRRPGAPPPSPGTPPPVPASPEPSPPASRGGRKRGKA